MGEHALSLTTSLSLSEDRIANVIQESSNAAERKLVEAQEQLETGVIRRVDDLNTLVEGVSSRITEALDDRTAALTTGLALSEDRFTQAIEDHAKSSESRLVTAHRRIESDLGNRMNDLGELVAEHRPASPRRLMTRPWL